VGTSSSTISKVKVHVVLKMLFSAGKEIADESGERKRESDEAAAI